MYFVKHETEFQYFKQEKNNKVNRRSLGRC
jgi:hypothetical protein